MSFGRDSDPRYGSFTLRTDCPTCAAPVPVNGPEAAVVCGGCGHVVPIPGGLVRELLDDFEAGWPKPPGAGLALRGANHWRWTTRPARAPACPACGEVLRVDAEAEGTLTCSCGATVAVAPVPGPLAASVPSAQRVFRFQEPPPVGAPGTVSCPQCGANVALAAADDRLARCGHCEAQVTVPPEVWRALHPVRAVHPWTVRFGGPSRRTLEAQAAAAARAAEEASGRAKRRAFEAEQARAAAAARAAAEAAEAAEMAIHAAAVARRAALRRKLLWLWFGLVIAGSVGFVVWAALQPDSGG